jgi:hypothetical protein
MRTQLRSRVVSILSLILQLIDRILQFVTVFHHYTSLHTNIIEDKTYSYDCDVARVYITSECWLVAWLAGDHLLRDSEPNRIICID